MSNKVETRENGQGVRFISHMYAILVFHVLTARVDTIYCQSDLDANLKQALKLEGYKLLMVCQRNYAIRGSRWRRLTIKEVRALAPKLRIWF